MNRFRNRCPIPIIVTPNPSNATDDGSGTAVTLPVYDPAELKSSVMVAGEPATISAFKFA